MEIRYKNKQSYSTPSVKTSEVALESLLCQSLRFRVEVDPLQNMNDPSRPEGEYGGEIFYFE